MINCLNGLKICEYQILRHASLSIYRWDNFNRLGKLFLFITKGFFLIKIKRGWIEILPRLNPISYEKPSCEKLWLRADQLCISNKGIIYLY